MKKFGLQSKILVDCNMLVIFVVVEAPGKGQLFEPQVSSSGHPRSKCPIFL